MTKQTQVRSTEEALKLALEVLEQLQGGCTDHNDGTVEAITVWCPEVITAIREALAEQTAPVAEPRKQEPVSKDWRHVIPGRRHTDQGDSARVTDYNQGWNDCQKKTKAELDKLYTTPQAQPAQRKPLTPEWYAQWIRNNYQDYWNIATLCDEMTKAAHNIKENA